MALVVLGSLLIKKEQKGHKRVVLLPEQNDPKKGPFTPWAKRLQQIAGILKRVVLLGEQNGPF